MKTQIQESEREKLYYSKSGLKARGWTDAMIRDLLADIEIKYGPSCAAGHPGFNFQYRYEDAKVEAIEKTKAFKERKERRRAKSTHARRRGGMVQKGDY